MLEQHPARAEANEIIGRSGRKVFGIRFQESQSSCDERAKGRGRRDNKIDLPDVCVADDTPAGVFGAPRAHSPPVPARPAFCCSERLYLRQCTFYRVEQKLEQLRQAGFESRLHSARPAAAIHV